MTLNQAQVTIRTRQYEMWKKVYTYPHEMQINKGGRAIHPKLEYMILGLEPAKLYSMMLHFELANDSHFSYRDGSWQPEGEAYSHKPKVVWHEAGVRNGTTWMNELFDFNFVKLTNDLNTNSKNKIFLHVCQKYIPVLSIYEFSSPECMISPPATFRFRHTEFIAVNAVKNPLMHKLRKTYEWRVLRAQHFPEPRSRLMSLDTPPVVEVANKSASPKDVLKMDVPSLPVSPTDSEKLPMFAKLSDGCVSASSSLIARSAFAPVVTKQSNPNAIQNYVAVNKPPTLGWQHNSMRTTQPMSNLASQLNAPGIATSQNSLPTSPFSVSSSILNSFPPIYSSLTPTSVRPFFSSLSAFQLPNAPFTGIPAFPLQQTLALNNTEVPVLSQYQNSLISPPLVNPLTYHQAPSFSDLNAGIPDCSLPSASPNIEIPEQDPNIEDESEEEIDIIN